MTPTPIPSIDPSLALDSLSWDGVATVIAALLAAVTAIVGYGIQQGASRKASRAATYSEALRAVDDYLEAPYLVRRRDGSAAARLSVTSHISDIQSRLSYYCTLLEVQAHVEISTAYQALVSAARSESGPAMSSAWRTRPTRHDRDVPIASRHDRSRSDDARRSYIDAVKRRDS